ncbi:hypothetical protein M514_07393 [Trichuris suis]|uniref:Uncharacterized protein n=1 Tax=Trichuris suis TaxID=68888 RepID=A0A085NC83_9BILA|nr:hypothetical protein M513_07393 [Trichuris suis]KFD67079.1 hypothetical protein M514_07393 [Trichuris suis]
MATVDKKGNVTRLLIGRMDKVTPMLSALMKLVYIAVLTFPKQRNHFFEMTIQTRDVFLTDRYSKVEPMAARKMRRRWQAAFRPTFVFMTADVSYAAQYKNRRT